MKYYVLHDVLGPSGQDKEYEIVKDRIELTKSCASRLVELLAQENPGWRIRTIFGDDYYLRVACSPEDVILQLNETAPRGERQYYVMIDEKGVIAAITGVPVTTLQEITKYEAEHVETPSVYLRENFLDIADKCVGCPIKRSAEAIGGGE